MNKKALKPDGLMRDAESKKEKKDRKNVGKYASIAAAGIPVVAAELWRGNVDDEAIAIPEIVTDEGDVEEMDSFAVETAVEDYGELLSDELTSHLEQKPIDMAEEKVEEPILDDEPTVELVDEVSPTQEPFAIESLNEEPMQEPLTISNPAPYMAQIPVEPIAEEVLDEEIVPAVEPAVAMTDEMSETPESFTIEESVEDESELDYITVDDFAPHLAQALVEPTVEDVIGEEDVPLFASAMSVDAIDDENAQTVEMDSVFAFNEIDPADKDGENILTFDKVGTMIGEDGQVMATATYFDDGQHLMLVDTDGDQIFDHIASTEGKIYFPVDYNLSVGDVTSMIDGNDTYLATTDVDSSSYDTSSDLITT